MKNRIELQHGHKGDNITEDAWDELANSDIYYAKMANRTMADVMESVLVKRYKPKYNKAKKHTDWDGLPLQEPNFIVYRDSNTRAVEKLRKDNERLISEIKKLKDNISFNELALNNIEQEIKNKNASFIEISKPRYERLLEDQKRLDTCILLFKKLCNSKYLEALEEGLINPSDMCLECNFRKTLEDIETIIYNPHIQKVSVGGSLVESIKKEFQEKVEKYGEDNNIC